MPDATIVIPRYNAAAYVEAALRSALGQTCRDIEVIAVDDRSTDATPRILDDWAARDPRLVVLRQAVNGGPSAACNAAYAIARAGARSASHHPGRAAPAAARAPRLRRLKAPHAPPTPDPGCPPGPCPPGRITAP